MRTQQTMTRPVEGVTIRRPPETACRQDPTSHAGRTHEARRDKSGRVQGALMEQSGRQRGAVRGKSADRENGSDKPKASLYDCR